jgi:hypothetical protein
MQERHKIAIASILLALYKLDDKNNIEDAKTILNSAIDVQDKDFVSECSLELAEALQ